LELHDPSIVKKRPKRFLMTPELPYEEKGFVDNVVFPCATLCDSEGRVTIYYGAADTYLAMAFTTIDRLVDFVKDN
jgi:beta-1,4-mannooligosaccharide/beta-1,4-mannosyl-N-acetylglucosamine phosphorylase